jgi:alkylhydroperoxidase family enzyme
MSFTLPAVAEMTPQQREFYDGFPLNLSRGLVLTKSSAKPYLSFGLSFLDGWLPAGLRELTILRVGALTGAHYEVFHHRPIALAVGVAEDTVE